MRPKKNERVYYCGVEVSLEKIGGRWKPLILWHLQPGTRRFGELKRLIPNITEKMLTEKLRELENDGLVHREVYREVPPKVEYSLTPYGRGLEGILKKLCDWGKEHARRSGLRIESSPKSAHALPGDLRDLPLVALQARHHRAARLFQTLLVRYSRRDWHFLVRVSAGARAHRCRHWLRTHDYAATLQAHRIAAVSPAEGPADTSAGRAAALAGSGCRNRARGAPRRLAVRGRIRRRTADPTSSPHATPKTSRPAAEAGS